MRLVAAGIVLGLIGYAVVAADDGKGKGKGPKLEPYTSEAGRFKVSFPDDDPKTERKDIATPAGVLTMTTERADLGRDVVLSVTYADYPDGFRDLNVKTIFDGVRDGLKGDGRLAEDRNFELGTVDGKKYEGRHTRVDAGRNSIRCWAYLSGTRLYQVMAAGPKDAVTGKTVDEFLRSFEPLP